MAALGFQLQQLRVLCNPQWCSLDGDTRSNHFQRISTPSGNGSRAICIKLQVSSVQQPTTELEVPKVSGESEHEHSQSAAKPEKTRTLAQEERHWHRLMTEIRTSGDAVQVLEKRRKARGLTKDTLKGIFMRLKQSRGWTSVMKICEWLREQDWWEFGFEDYCLLMAAYGKEGQPEKAETLLEGYFSAGHKPNVAMYTGLLDAYARKRMFDKAEALLQKLLKSGPAPTVLTYHTLMKAYTQDDRLEDAERIFASMTGDVKPDGRSYNLMIHAYGKSGMGDKAFELYKEMRALNLTITVVTFNTLIANQQSVRDAGSIFRQMKAAKLQPDVFSYTALMNSYAKAGKIEKAQALLTEMVFLGIRPTATTYNVLLDAYAKSRQVDEAESILKQMRKDKCIPTIHSFTTLVRAYALVGNMQKAEEILRRMKSENVTPNVFTFCTMLTGYASAGDWEKMIKTFNDMKTLGVKPNQAVYTVLIGACGLQDDFEASKFWFREMISSGLRADQRARNALTKASKTPDQFLEAQALAESCT